MTKLRRKDKKGMTEFCHQNFIGDEDSPFGEKGDDRITLQAVPDDDKIKSDEQEDDGPFPVTNIPGMTACSVRSKNSLNA